MLKKNKDRSRSLNEELNPTDTTCLVCGKELYELSNLRRLNNIYTWQYFPCGECLKFKEDECCHIECIGADNRVPK
jgi:hypothetical protein